MYSVVVFYPTSSKNVSKFLRTEFITKKKEAFDLLDVGNPHTKLLIEKTNICVIGLLTQNR